MCGRYASTSTPEQLLEAFQVDEIKTEQLPIRYNVAPTQPVYAVAERRPPVLGSSTRQLGELRWGLVPSWAKDLSVGARMINARAESVATKPAYRDALLRRRCLIPADAFYEWQAQPGGASKDARLPYAIRRLDGRPMAFAGLWEVWRPPGLPDAPLVRSCTIVTTEANALLAPVHHRMPVVLAPDDWSTWLDRSNQDLDSIVGLLLPAPPEDLVVYPVSTRVNRAANNTPDLLDPVPAGTQ